MSPTGEPIDFSDSLPDSTADIAEALRAATDATGAALTPTDDTAKETPAVEAAPTEPTAEAAATEKPTAVTDEGADRIIIDALKDLCDLDMTGKYKSDVEFAKGMKHLQEKLSQRDSEADFGRRVFQTYGDPFAQPQQQTVQPPYRQAQAQQPQPPPSREQLLLWQSQVRKNPETGEYESVPGAEPGVVQKLQQAQDRMQQALLSLAYTPEEFLQARLAPVLQQMLQQANQQTAQELAARDAQQWQNQETLTWAGSNASWLFRNGKDPSGGLTAIGSGFENTFETMMLAGVPLTEHVKAGHIPLAEALELARMRYKDSIPATTPAQPPRQQAAHVPNVAAMAAVAPDPAEPLPNESMHDHFARVLASIMPQQ